LLQLIDAKRSSLREGVDRIKLSHLFLPLEKKDFAEQLRKEIEVGGDFNALVQKHSIDSISVEKNGDLGWFNVHDLPDYFATTVPTVKEGGISPVIESPFGLHLVRVVEINKQELNAEKTQEWARGIVHERKALENRLEWLEQLRGSAHIIVLDPEYAGIINQENE
jgi:peptidyl-prolyl cis-trans isomerase SurA